VEAKAVEAHLTQGDKMRLFTSVLASVAVLLSASLATAQDGGVFFDLLGTSGADPSNMQLGESITLDIRIGNDSSPSIPIFGLGASVYDYNTVLGFVSGEAVDGYLYEIVIPGTGAFNGLSNTVGGSLSESAITGNPLRVQIANSAGLDGRTGCGCEDPGLDGVIGGGDAQFRVTFTALAPGTVDVIIGTGYQGDVVVLEGGATTTARNAGISITVVPEPGAVVLMGLGLAGLAFAGRRD
jgi:hypothetical protein